MSLLGFGLASPLVFLMYAASIYHESVLWGLALSIAFSSVLLANIESSNRLRANLPLLAAIGGATLLARVTYGAPLYLILLFIAGTLILEVSRQKPNEIVRETGRTVLLLLPAGATLLFQLWYNYDRFGSILTFVDYGAMDFMANDAPTMEILRESGSFNARRIFSAFNNYLGIRSDFISTGFPWFRIASPVYPEAELYPLIFKSYLISLSVSASWIVASSALGAYWLFDRGRSALVRLCALAFFLEVLLVSSYFIMEERYLVDYFPFLIFSFALFLGEAATRSPLRGRAPDILTVLIFAIGVSSIATLGSSLSAIPRGGPALSSEYKELWKQRFKTVDAQIAELRGD